MSDGSRGYFMIPRFAETEEPEDVPIPYYAIVLTSEQAKKVEHTEITFFTIEGRTLFPVKDSNGKETGEFVLYVLFRS